MALLLASAVAQADGGSRIVFARDGKIWKMQDDGTNETALTNPSWPYTDSHPSICPNGRAIVFDRGGDIYKIGQNGGTPVNLTPGTDDDNDFDPDCGSDGQTIYVVYVHQPLNGDAETYRKPLTGGSPVNLTDNDVEDDQPSICGSDKVVFMRYDGSDRDVFRMDLDDGDNEQQVTSNSYEEEFPACRPDGLRVAFARRFDQSSQFTDIIERVIASGSEADLTETTEYAVKDYNPTYSPGGTYIAFSRTNQSLGGVYQVFKQLAEPGETAEQLTPDPGHSGIADYPDWGELAP